MQCRSTSDERALSPVIGGVLLIAIAIVLVSLTAVMIFGTTDETPPAPTSNFEVKQTDGGYVLKITAGDTIDGDRLRIQGIKDPDVLAGREFKAGDQIAITPTGEEIDIIWREQAPDGVSYELQSFTVEPLSPIAPFARGTIFTGASGNEVVQIAGDGGEVTTLYNGKDVDALGPPATGVVGNSEANIPFVADDETVGVLSDDGTVTTVAKAGDIPGSIGTDKTRLAIGRWNGSEPSVFFVNQNHDTIYRTTPSTSPVSVATPGDGAQSIVGVADIDGDDTDELLFGDGSQTLQYLESDGSVVDTKVSGGSSTGIGTGSVAEFDDDGRAEVGVVDGGNNIQIVDGNAATQIDASDVAGSSAPQAEKSPTAAGDVDSDQEAELIYVGNDNEKLKYLDDIGGTIKIEFLEDSDGDKIDGSKLTGVS